jgi:hypothetical protein
MKTSTPAIRVHAEPPKKVPDHWAIESTCEREKLPLYKTIPAAKPQEFTSENSFPRGDAFVAFALPKK